MKCQYCRNISLTLEIFTVTFPGCKNIGNIIPVLKQCLRNIHTLSKKCQYCVIINLTLELFPMKCQYFINISLPLEIYTVNFPDCKNIGKIIPVLKQCLRNIYTLNKKCQYCVNINLTLELFPMKCQYCKNISLAMEIYTINFPDCKNIGNIIPVL